jgi:hypothetical protein
MNHTLPVRVIDGVADLAGEVECPGHIERSVRADQVFEGLALHVLHHDEEHVLLFFGRRDRDDVGMADAGEQPRLPQQLAEVEALPVRNFDRDLLVDPGIVREVDRTKPTAAERRDDLVLSECLAPEQQRWCSTV